MRLKDLQVVGAVTRPSAPTVGLLNNVLLMDKWRGAYPSAVSPLGSISLTSGDDSFQLAGGVTGVMFVPNDPDKIGSSGEEMYRQFQRLFQIERFVSEDGSLEYPNDLKDDTFFVTANRRRVVIGGRHHSYEFLLSQLQKIITGAKGPGHVTPVPYGLAQVGEGEVIYPRRKVSFHGYQMELELDGVTLKLRDMREKAKYASLLVVAMLELKRAMDDHSEAKRTVELDLLDYYAYANWLMGAYGSFDKEAPMNYLLQANDLIPKSLQMLGLPWSEAYREMSLTGKLDDKEMKLIKAWMSFNICLTFAAERAGGWKENFSYEWRKGAVINIKEALPYYIRPSVDMGGSNHLWFHPARMRDVVDGVYFPAAFRKNGKVNVWARRNTFDESFDDAIIERGEIAQDSEERMRENKRVVVSRDARVIIARSQLERYLMVSVPVFEDKNETEGFGLLLSYATDPVTKFGGAMFVAPDFLAIKPLQAFDPSKPSPSAIPGGPRDVSGTSELVGVRRSVKDNEEPGPVVDDTGLVVEDEAEEGTGDDDPALPEESEDAGD